MRLSPKSRSKRHFQRRNSPTWLASAVVISEDAVCRLCGEEEEPAEHIWLRGPSLLLETHHSDLGNRMDELVRLQRAALALLRIILWRLRQQLQRQHRMAMK